MSVGGDGAEEDGVLCPERHCSIKMNTRTEMNAHLRWDHNRNEAEAEAILDSVE